jgi:hypothetical protein
VPYNVCHMNDFQNESFVRKNAIWLVVFVALVIFGFLLFKGWDKVVNEEIDSMVTITGNFSCLPHKTEIAKPETCILGVRSRDGLHYALDISRIQDANTDLKAEDTIAVTGTLKPEDEIPTSEWSNYDVSGIVLVNTLLRTR